MNAYVCKYTCMYSFMCKSVYFIHCWLCHFFLPSKVLFFLKFSRNISHYSSIYAAVVMYRGVASLSSLQSSHEGFSCSKYPSHLRIKSSQVKPVVFFVYGLFNMYSFWQLSVCIIWKLLRIQATKHVVLLLFLHSLIYLLILLAATSDTHSHTRDKSYTFALFFGQLSALITTREKLFLLPLYHHQHYRHHCYHSLVEQVVVEVKTENARETERSHCSHYFACIDPDTHTQADLPRNQLTLNLPCIEVNLIVCGCLISYMHALSKNIRKKGGVYYYYIIFA